MSTTAPEPVRLAEKFAAVDKPWTPYVVGELNGQYVKVDTFEGEYVWHHHENEDEMFLVHQGELRIELRNGNVDLGPGDFFIVPRKVEHRPVALSPSCLVVLFEPAETRNTGNVDHAYTIEADALKKL
jgi:mannose-6-phosphate isomerase-like protein (cupin superfamily)